MRVIDADHIGCDPTLRPLANVGDQGGVTLQGRAAVSPSAVLQLENVS